MTIEVHVVREQELAKAAADLLLTLLPESTPVLGVATGSTPLGLYAELAVRAARGTIDLSAATLVALDEYVGLSPRDPASYAHYLLAHVAKPLGIPPQRLIIPRGDTDPRASASEFARRIDAIDRVHVQIAGIGTNGHLGFNEPGSRSGTGPHAVQLTETTRHDNAIHFEGDLTRVPRVAVTQGISTILKAETVLLLAKGERKAPALRDAIQGAVSRQIPASFLQRHPHAVLIADEAAARLLA